jgi:two-component system chemotaxis response regulator CheB
LAKPTFVELDGPAGAQLCERVRLLAGVTVIHHARPERVVSTLAPPISGRGSPAGVVVIGASTGGPNVLAQILGMLPAEFPLPIAIVQHLAGGFAPHFGRWLADGCELQVEIASPVSRLAPGKVLVAADERNLLINGDGHRVRLTREAHGSGYCPSVDLLFESAARCFRQRSIGIVLSGMGRDGASGVAALAAVGGTTVAQRGSTCAVDGMPAAARATGKVSHFLAPEEIGLLLLESAYELSRFAPSARDS